MLAAGLPVSGVIIPAESSMKHLLLPLFFVLIGLVPDAAWAQEEFPQEIVDGPGVIPGEIPAEIFWQGEPWEQKKFYAGASFVRSLPDGTILHYAADGDALIYLHRVDEKGRVLWQKKYGLGPTILGYGRVLKHQAANSDELNILLWKYDLPRGFQLPSPDSEDFPDSLGFYSQRQEETGRYVLAEGYPPIDGKSDIVMAEELWGVIRIDGDGKLLWHRLAYQDLKLQVISAIRPDPTDGGVWVGGIALGDADHACGAPAIVKLDRLGRELWRWQEEGNYSVRAPETIQPLAKGGVIAIVRDNWGLARRTIRPEVSGCGIYSGQEERIQTKFVRLDRTGQMIDQHMPPRDWGPTDSVKLKNGKIIFFDGENYRTYDSRGRLLVTRRFRLDRMIGLPEYGCDIHNDELTSTGDNVGYILVIGPSGYSDLWQECQAWPKEYYGHGIRHYRTLYFPMDERGGLDRPLTLHFDDGFSLDLSSDGKNIFAADYFGATTHSEIPILRRIKLPH